jgi:hypothetical protein
MALDPTTAYQQPPQPAQQQDMPGETGRMTPRPDHGETSGLTPTLGTLVRGRR